MRVGPLLFALAILGCGSSGGARPHARTGPAPRRAPVARPTPPTPEPPRPIRATLADLVPDPAPASPDRGIDPSGRFYCRWPLTFEPGPEDAGCDFADGVSIRTRLVHLWDFRAVGLYIDGPVAIERVTRCGERRRPLPRSALGRVAPELARARPADGVDTAAFTFGACRDPRLSIEMPAGARHTMAGAVHRFELTGGSGELRILLAEHALASWPIGEGTIGDLCDRGETVPVRRRVDLEVACSADHAVVAGGSSYPERCWPCYARCRLRPGPPPGIACTVAPREGLDARRFLVPLVSGDPVAVEIHLPQLR